MSDGPTQLRGSAKVANKLASKTLLPASIIGLAHWLFSDLDPDEAGYFLARLTDGDGLAADDPISALRNRIVKMRVGGGRGQRDRGPGARDRGVERAAGR